MQTIPLSALLEIRARLEILSTQPDASTHMMMELSRVVGQLNHFVKAATAGIHLGVECEQQRIAADLHINALKNSGALQRMEADRAMAEQLKWEAV